MRFIDGQWKRDSCCKCLHYREGYCSNFRQPVYDDAALRCGEYCEDTERVRRLAEENRRYVGFHNSILRSSFSSMQRRLIGRKA